MPKYDADRLDALLPCSPLVAVPDARAGVLAMASVDLRPLLPPGRPPLPIALPDSKSFVFELGALPAVAPMGEALALTRPCACDGRGGLLVAAAQVVDGASAAALHELAFHERWRDTKVAAASRTNKPRWARALLTGCQRPAPSPC